MTSLLHFLNMGGYGVYVWTSYTLVLSLLGIQWFIPWRRWHDYRRELTHHE